MAAEREAAQTLSSVDVVAHYVSQPLPRDRAATQRLIKSMRALRRDDDAHGDGDGER